MGSVRTTRGRSTRAGGGFAVVLSLLALFSPIAAGDDIPLQLEADELFIAADQKSVWAEGAVVVELEGVRVSAETLDLRQEADAAWRFVASGDVRVDIEGEMSLAGNRLAATLDAETGVAFPQSLVVETFGGESRFVNSRGEEHTIYFRGETGHVTFDAAGEATLIEVEDAEVTTCSCCGLSFRSQPYTLRASRLQLYPDRLIVVSGLTARIAGVPFFWLPVYAQPLEETLESPLFPAIGRSALRGWYLKWNVPFFVSESLYGSVLLDYYAAFGEVGSGIVTRYAFADHEGRFRIYHLPAKIGDDIFEISASHQLPPGKVWSGSGKVSYRAEGETTDLDYSAEALGSRGEWDVRLSAAREVQTREVDGEEAEITRVTERLPEVSITREPWTEGDLHLEPTFEVGRYREETEDGREIEAMRAGASLEIGSTTTTIAGIDVTPSLLLQGTVYRGSDFERSRGTMHAGIEAQWDPIRVDYDLVLVRGSSPFEFDAEAASHHLGWEVTGRAGGRLTVAGGIALDTLTLDPLQARLTWADWARWTLGADYDLVEASLVSVRLSGNSSHDELQLTWSIPYVPAEGRLGRVQFTAHAQGDRFRIDLDATVDDGILRVGTRVGATLPLDPLTVGADVRFDDLAVSSVSLSTELATPAGWGGHLEWTHTGGTLSWRDLRYGIFKDVGECLRVGIDREASDTWFYLSVLAFPEAIIRYAPASSRVQTGE